MSIFFLQKYKKLPLKRIILLLIVMASMVLMQECSLFNKSNTPGRSEKKKAQIENKQKKELEKKRNKAKDRHLSMQSEQTLERMDHLEKKSKKWKRKNYHNNSNFLQSIEYWWKETFSFSKKPDQGLFKKKRTKKKSKKFLIFKRKKK